ncbi:MAG TPA: hypothetical protein VJ739_06395 [Gemmataceae bacterium]|nr:hypothetical protein [Gemmataceae bacterium]
MNRLLGLVLGAALLWLLLALPARWLWGDAALRLSLAALGLCLAPGLVTVALGAWVKRRPAEEQMLVLLGSTALRMAVVLAGGLALFFRAPGFHEASFWGWVLVFYLGTLALEMGLLLKARSAPGPSI